MSRLNDRDYIRRIIQRSKATQPIRRPVLQPFRQRADSSLTARARACRLSVERQAYRLAHTDPSGTWAVKMLGYVIFLFLPLALSIRC
jgi:hypothetical protein